MFQISDFAGNTLTSAKRIDAMSPGTLQGRIEYKGDIDFYGFQASSTKTYQVSVAANGTLETGSTLMLAAYSQDGTLISTSVSGSLFFSITKGKVYYVKVYINGQTAYSQNQRYILYWG